mmetsp:Transcript_9539/g.22987  ORF Transcript_9539/g.22987 Transcript_9539/m.22987 type:complete len:350 (+) Transcript_9539:39-1088(+)
MAWLFSRKKDVSRQSVSLPAGGPVPTSTPRKDSKRVLPSDLSHRQRDSVGDISGGGSYISKCSRGGKDASGKRRAQTFQPQATDDRANLPPIVETETPRNAGPKSMEDSLDIPGLLKDMGHETRMNHGSGSHRGRRPSSSDNSAPSILASQLAESDGGSEAADRPASSHMRTSLLARVLRPYTEGGSHRGSSEECHSSAEEEQTVVRTQTPKNQITAEAQKGRRAYTFDVNTEKKQKAFKMLLGETPKPAKGNRVNSDAMRRRPEAASRSRKLKAMMSGDLAEQQDDEVPVEVPDLQPKTEDACWRELWEVTRAVMEDDSPEVAETKSMVLIDDLPPVLWSSPAIYAGT